MEKSFYFLIITSYPSCHYFLKINSKAAFVAKLEVESYKKSPVGLITTYLAATTIDESIAIDATKLTTIDKSVAKFEEIE